MAAWQQNIYHRHAHYTTTSSVNSGQWIETPVATSTAGMSSTRQSQASDLNGESRLRWQHLSQACPMHDNLKHQFWPVNRDSDGNIYRGHIQYTTTSSISSGLWIETPMASSTAGISNTRQPRTSALAGESSLRRQHLPRTCPIPDSLKRQFWPVTPNSCGEETSWQPTTYSERRSSCKEPEFAYE